MVRGPKEKKERALGERLQLKGERCNSPKCAAVRKPHRPGQHGNKRQRRALSEFGVQLKEKQKFKVVYGLGERELRGVFKRASQSSGSVSVQLMEILERRLDNVIYRLSFALSRSFARQLVVHGHVLVNGARARSPGILLYKGDVISFRKESQTKVWFIKVKESLKDYEAPSWLSLDKEKMTGTLLAMPPITEIPFNANLLVESFSK